MASGIRGSLVVSTGLAVLFGASAFAQTNVPEPTASASPETQATEETGESDEIVVTAQFRSARVQDTPLTVQAIDGEALEQRSITGLKDLAVRVAGFQAGGTYQAAPQLNIRGSRSSTIDISSEDSIATYFDGVYVARPAATTLDLVNLERVEILKGPQGTLYGRNAVGGVINYISRTPQDEVSAQVTTEFGNYDALNVRVLGNAPLVEGRLFANFALSSREHDGYVENLYTGNDLGTEDSDAARVGLRWIASDDLEFVLRGDYNESHNIGPGFSTVRQTTAAYSPGPPPSGSQEVWFDPQSTDPMLNPTGRVISNIHQSLQSEDGYEDRIAWGTSLTTNYSSPEINVVGITAFRNLKADQLSDFDGTPCSVAPTSFLAAANVQAFAPGHPNLLGPARCVTLNDTVTVPFLLNQTVPQAFGMTTDAGFEARRLDHAEQYSQEVRLLSTPDGFLTFGGRMSWVLGGMYFFEEAQRDQQDALFGTPDARVYYAHNETESIGLYSQATFEITDMLSLTLGLRYSEDTKDYEFSVRNRPVTAILASSGGNTVLVNPLDFSSTINYSNLPGIFGFPTGFPNPALTNGAGICAVGYRCVPLTQTSATWTSTDPLVRLEFRPTDDLLFYGSFTEGFKSGGFSTTPEDIATGTTPYEPETIRAYEVGVKSTWFDRMLTANLSLYRNDSENVQIQSGYDHDNNPGTRPFVGVRNAAALVSQGAELELRLRPTDSLTLFTNYAYTDAHFEDFLVFGGGVVVADNSGNRPIGTPEHSATIGVEYEVDLSADWVMRFNADWNYKSHVFFTESNFPEAAQDAYSLVNASVSLGRQDDGLEVRLWSNNLFDEDYITHILSGGAGRTTLLGTVINANTYTVIPGAPQTYGVALTWRFGG